MEENFNSTIRKFLESQMGPQHISPAVVLPITVVYVLIFVSGVIGNVVVCLVVIKNSHFQTPTNYYLFSLAISDLLILIFGLPNDLKVYWQQYPWVFGEVVCKLRALIAEMTSYASVLTIVAFTMERYIAICHPLFIQTVSTLPRAIKFITLVWIMACISAVPFAIFTKINYLEYPTGSGRVLQQSAFCALSMESPDINRPLVQFATIAFFVLPMSLIIILYLKISLKLRESRFSRLAAEVSSRQSQLSRDGRQNMVRRSVNKMLVAVVIAFFLCWAPFHAQRLLAVCVDQDNWTIQLRTINEVLYYTAGCLYYFSATINPILYSLMSAKYRTAFRDALCSFSGERKRSRDWGNHRHPRNNSENTFGPYDRESSIRMTFEPFKNCTNPNIQGHQIPKTSNCSSRKSVRFYRNPGRINHEHENEKVSTKSEEKNNIVNGWYGKGIPAVLVNNSVLIPNNCPESSATRAFTLNNNKYTPEAKDSQNASGNPKIIISSYDSEEYLEAMQFDSNSSKGKFSADINLGLSASSRAENHGATFETCV